jgi:cytosine/adenosine deaminase-related metal-dependent hydrolase
MITEATFRSPVYAVRPDVVLAANGPLEDHTIVVDQGRIAAVAPADDLPAHYRSLDVERLDHCAIVPGFIDAHHHVIEPFAKALTCGEPAQMWKRIWFPLEAAATPRTCYLGAKWTFLEALRGGITTIVEHAIRSAEVADAVHVAAEETGIRLVSSTGAYDLKNFSTAASTPEASASVDEAICLADKHVASCRQFSRVVPSLACGTVQSNSGEMITALSHYCRDHNILFQIHANEHTPEVHACIEAYGKRPIELLHSLDALGPHTLIAHATLVTPSELRLLKESDTAVAYNPVASMWKGNSVAPALDFIAQGIRFGLGSDATRNDGFRMIEAAESCQRIAYGMPKDDFSCGAGWPWVFAATQGGADACGLGQETGAIVPGRRADFLVLDLSHPEVLPSWDFTWELVRFYDRANLLATVVDGKLVMLGGRSTLLESDRFFRDSIQEGMQWIREARLVRLHGRSDEYRS